MKNDFGYHWLPLYGPRKQHTHTQTLLRHFSKFFLYVPQKKETTWCINDDKILILFELTNQLQEVQKTKAADIFFLFILFKSTKEIQLYVPPCNSSFFSFSFFYCHVLIVSHSLSFLSICSDTQLVVGGSEHLCVGTKQEAISGWMVFSTVIFVRSSCSKTARTIRLSERTHVIFLHSPYTC